MNSSLQLAIFLLLLPTLAFAENDEVLSHKIVGHWVTGRSDLFFYSNHNVTYSNIKAPSQDKHGTWAIKDGWLDISFWRKHPGTGIFYCRSRGIKWRS